MSRLMQVWPAIDLRLGRCVRLEQGDYGRETVFGDDPAGMARQWVAEGATCLHLVDLDAAKQGADSAGRLPNGPAIQAIVRAVGVPCQVGGGVRSEATIEYLLDLGVSRLVVGTAAIKQPDWFRGVCRRFPDRLVLGIDARNGRVATDGWIQTSDVPATQLASHFAGEPLAGIVYTDIARDGMLCGPNLSAIQEMLRATDFPVIASGGVTSADDVAKLAEIGLAGCIVGRALYEGKLSLAEALAAASLETAR
jgi:phosphoribosylformimino-5-aminoimidazole carboxamide ribotide isomerase